MNCRREKLFLLDRKAEVDSPRSSETHKNQVEILNGSNMGNTRCCAARNLLSASKKNINKVKVT